MSGYINSIRKAIGKAIGKGGDDTPKPKTEKEAFKEQVEAEGGPVGDEPVLYPLQPKHLSGEQSSFDIPRTEKFVEDMKGEPPPNIMEMGRPDDGNLNIRLMQEDPKIKQAAELLNIGQNRFKDTPIRQKQTNVETVAKSESVKVLTRALNKGPDPSYTATEVVALGRFNKEVTEILTENTQKFIKQLEDGTISQDELLALSYLEDVAIAAQQKWADSGTVTGRALQARNALTNNTTSKLYQDAAKSVTDIKGGRIVIQERMKLYAEGKSLEDVMYRINLTRGEKVWKEIFFWRYNMMLSSFRTAAANFGGGVAVGLNENFVVKPLSVAINKGEQGIRWLAGKRGKQLSADEAMVWREAIPDWEATRIGYGRGFRGAADIIAGREIRDGKFFNEIGTRYDVNDIPQGQGAYDTAKRQAGKVTRSLEAVDAIFRGMSYQQELSRIAWRRARNSFDDVKTATAAYNEIMRFPPEDLVQQANQFAKYSVFANDPNLYSNIFGAITNSAAALQQNSKLAQILMPFVKVVGNLAIYGKNHALAPLSSKFMQDVVGKDPIRRAEALARLTESAGIMTLLHGLWEDGLVTGMGHPDRDARAAAARAGYPPNSIKVDGEWVNISRLDPVGMIIALAATTFENMEANDEDPITGVVNTMLSMGQLLQDRAMLATIGDTFAVVSGQASTGMKADILTTVLSAGTVAITQPGLVRDFRQMADPVRRQMEVEDNIFGWAQRAKLRFMNAWPGLSDNLPPSRDWRGDIVVNQSSAIARGMLPISRRKPMTDDSTLALLQFDVGLNKPEKTLSLPGAGIKLNLLGVDGGQGWVYNKYTKFIGKLQAEEVDAVMDSSFKKDWEKAIVNGEIADGLLYEELQEELSAAVSRGRKIGKLDFLDWLNKRETVPGKTINEETGERQKIAVDGIFDWDNYLNADDRAILRNMNVQDKKIYTKKGTITLPAIQKTIEQTVEF